MVEKVSLNGAKILVLEDEPYVALDLAQAIEQAHGVVVGPLASVAAALESLRREPVDAAILGCGLADRAVQPLLDALTGTNAAVVLLAARDIPAELTLGRPEIVVFSKPSPTVRLCDRLLRMLDK
jgi:DNA-binding response OmpR family regulator